MNPPSSAGGKTDGATSPEPPEPPVIHSHIAYFLVPLPEPLGLPDKHRVVCAAPTSGEQYRKQQAEGLDAPPSHHLAASLMFHRVVSRSAIADDIHELFLLARTVLPDSGVADDRPSDTQPDGWHDSGATSVTASPMSRAQRTFVEMAVPLDAADADSEAAVSDAFDIGLRYVREVQRAYFLTRRRPIRLVTRETMPFGIPFGVRQLYEEDGESAPFQVPLSLFLLNQNFQREVRDEDMDDSKLKDFPHALWTQSRPGFLTDYLEFVREMHVALDVDGSHRAAVLFAATACEVLLDNLLSHMLWEEGERPEDAASVFDSWLTSRVKKHYHPRLGGQWAVDSPGPIQHWSADVAGLRNRVVHGGYEPSLEEAHRAMDAARVLATHLGDLLSDRVGTYPRTALILPGAVGLRRRGKWTATLNDLMHDAQEVNWGETFARWRTGMQRARADSPIYVAPSSRAAWVYAVIRVGGAVQWVIHDAGAGMAAVVDRAHLQNAHPHQLETLNSLRAAQAKSDAPEDVSVSLTGVTAPEPDPDDWVPEYRLVPMAGVMFDGKDLDPP